MCTPAAAVEALSLFPDLSESCKPIAAMSRRFTSDEKIFIAGEIAEWLRNDIVEECRSPWRAQLVVTKPTENSKRRMCVDNSQTINKYTELDAYPFARIEEMVHDLARYKYFSTFDLRSACHQIPIRLAERKYTAF